MMKQRCTNPKCRSYKWYGAKGINVCKEWLDVKVFCEWAITNGYRDGLTIERIDVNADYSPQNCKWIVSKEQAKNRTSTHYLTYNGETHSVTEWSGLLNIPRTTLSNRVRLGWSIERALTTPSRKGVCL
jgi:hypothetical protein